MSPGVELRTAVDVVHSALDAGVSRLPRKAQYWSRQAVRRAEPVIRRARGSRLVSPRVSIVLPVYNVERYLPACLDSILNQSYPFLEIIAVDDGSTDRSSEILRRYAALDARLHVVEQTNQGLGAARNAGVRHSHGRYLMFIDSDDVLLPDAIATCVRTLRASRSDFVVGLYQRVTASGTVPAAPWVRSAHQQARRRTSLTEFPQIQVNAVAWSKMYRRRFWDAAQLRFPTGVVYEDQPVSARAYARARHFDVLDQVIYQWRVREDRSSITQQDLEVADLDARFDAAFASLAELEAAGALGAKNVRLAQLLGNDFPQSLRSSQHASEEFWELLRTRLALLVEGADEEVWQAVPPQQRIAIQLAITNQREAMIGFIGLQHNSPKTAPTIVRNGRAYVQFPERHQLDLAEDDPMLALTDAQTSVITGIRRLFWRPDDRAEIHGWAYLDNLDLSRTLAPVTVLLADLEDPDQEPLELITLHAADPEVTARSSHQHANYENGVFRATVDPVVLAQRRPNGRWTVMVRVAVDGITKTAPLKGLRPVGSPGHLTGRLTSAGRVGFTYSRGGGLILTINQPSCVLDDARVEGNDLVVALTALDGFEAQELNVRNEVTLDESRTPLSGEPPHYSARLRLPVSSAPDPDGPPVPARQLWTARVIAATGRETNIAAVEDPAWEETLGPVRPRITQFGNLGLVTDTRALLVHGLEVLPDERLRLTARWPGGLATGDHLEVTLRSPAAGCSAPVEVAADGSATATLALTDDPWGLGRRPLAVGTYDLSVLHHRADGADPEAVAVRADYAAVTQLPLAVRPGRLRGEVQLAPGNRLRLQVEPPLSDDERGARPQRVLQDALEARRRADPGFEPGAVLFRSYYGEICGCNPLAVHEELRRRGTSHTLYWAVRDHSVVVPEGGIPVVYESAEWYRLLHDAEFYMDNMHQAIYHRKPAHQVQIQTFHGYPFKAMGQSHWRHLRRDVAHVKSYLDRAADWDYLVSPATYASEPLRREFGFPNEVLEIGYPRNDVLQGPASESIRDQVRLRLGIRADQTAVLYAPTFRDHLASNDFRATMTDYLDVAALAATLGERYVVLVRGHAFHARIPDRVQSHGTIVDVTDYPDINGLCLASDCAVLDYSSLRFDYGLTGRPMIFLVPDLEEYVQKSRGTLFAYEPTAPGPLLASTAEVADAVGDLAGVRSRYADGYATFRQSFLDLDDGHAAARLVDRVFLR